MVVETCRFSSNMLILKPSGNSIRGLSPPYRFSSGPWSSASTLPESLKNTVMFRADIRGASSFVEIRVVGCGDFEQETTATIARRATRA